MSFVAIVGIVELVGNCFVYGVVGKVWSDCWQGVGNLKNYPCPVNGLSTAYP